MGHNYSQYAELLSTKLNVGIAVLVLISCAMIAGIIVCLWMKQPQLAWFLVFFGVILVLLVYYFAFYPIQKDIETSNYVIYEGQFYVEDYYSVTKSGTYILIKTTSGTDAIRYRVACNNINIGVGGE